VQDEILKLTAAFLALIFVNRHRVVIISVLSETGTPPSQIRAPKNKSERNKLRKRLVLNEGGGPKPLESGALVQRAGER
jgi:hypothetical protein